jgi:DNA-directed RNA polymerase specialized sigma subunit
VSQSLQRLKKQSRDLLMMYYYAELSIVDIAKKLWVSRRRPYAGGYERLSNSSST